MTHHHDNSPLVGAVIGAVSGVYKSFIGVTAIITFDGIMETAIYAVVGSALGAVVSFSVNHWLKKLFKK